MMARHESDHQQIIAKGKEEERGVEDTHQHRAKISEMQQKGEDGANEFDHGSYVRFVGELGRNEKRTKKEAAPYPIEAAGAGSPFTRSVPYAIDRFFARVLCVPNFVVNRSFYLVDLTFGLKLFVAGDVSRNFLGLANNFICCAFHVFLVHKAPLPW